MVADSSIDAGDVATTEYSNQQNNNAVTPDSAAANSLGSVLEQYAVDGQKVSDEELYQKQQQQYSEQYQQQQLRQQHDEEYRRQMEMQGREYMQQKEQEQQLQQQQQEQIQQQEQQQDQVIQQQQQQQQQQLQQQQELQTPLHSNQQGEIPDQQSMKPTQNTQKNPKQFPIGPGQSRHPSIMSRAGSSALRVPHHSASDIKVKLNSEQP
eukprot:CAMPEP_0197523274 /NCGR_PEP_ID=MMETSP1318-20131121/8245_1 /TAXON_ID=552666 /ORGANISM="Partenskyella glossopodia, Strain RCC365" /LENGTH=208 /DNA_ID=CAMNT_0043075915 /DNA_START=180 /DNA_END=806 /DNA_ORIENTATION=-